MKRIMYVYIMIVVVACCSVWALSAKAENGTTGVVYAVSDDSDTDVFAVDEYSDGYSLSEIKLLYSDEENGISYYSAELHYDMKEYTIEEILNIMRLSGMYEEVSEDATMKSNAYPSAITDPYMDAEWYLDAIGAGDAWKLLEGTPGEGVTVAVIDSGIYYRHRDLMSNIWNLSAQANLGDILDESGHGTHVSGIIAMSAMDGGGVGVAYEAEIMPVKAGGSDGKFLISNVIEAFGYAIDNGADIINMSFGAEYESAVFKTELYNASKDHVLVAAAGNEGLANDDSDKEEAKNIYPAAYPFVIGVMSTDENNKLTLWSDYDTVPFSENEYEIAAPGANILSTYNDGKYRYMSGTSMASPVVAGAAALLWQYAEENKIADKAEYVYGQIRNAGTHKATHTDIYGDTYEYSLLNVYDAITTEPGVNISVGDYVYADSTSGTYFTDSVTINDSGRTDILCGFDVYNTWSTASDVRVTVEVDAPECSVISENEFRVDEMEYNQRISIGCDTYEAKVISFAGEAGHTYNIPIRYTVSATGYTKQYTDTITITVSTGESASPGSSDGGAQQVSGSAFGADAQTYDFTALKVKGIKGKSKKSSKHIIKWKKLDDADKYIIYYSKKRNGRYKRLAVTKKTRYVHKSVKNKEYFYKVRGMKKESGGRKVYSTYSKTIKI